ncbi:hypothetical protein [Microbispora sp. H11081]|nr:hypothetical protein [Microbispora sp. H11081]
MTTAPQATTWTTAARRHRFAAFLIDNLVLHDVLAGIVVVDVSSKAPTA